MLSGINNTQPSFGMAITKPAGKKNLQIFADRLGLQSSRAQRGLAKLVKKHDKIPRDIKMDFSETGGYLILGKDGKWFRHGSEIKQHGVISNFFRKIGAFFNPVKALPRDFESACKRAELLYKNEQAKERILNRTSDIFDKNTKVKNVIEDNKPLNIQPG